MSKPGAQQLMDVLSGRLVCPGCYTPMSPVRTHMCESCWGKLSNIIPHTIQMEWVRQSVSFHNMFDRFGNFIRLEKILHDHGFNLREIIRQ